ncbi:MAG: Mrp/NBP35 family ATP-binding protein [Terrimicrobiaceae bacterium]|nr:Mrp/NBP35 family ATP-binding protein [Terrimicrobiaceae bacterium]
MPDAHSFREALRSVKYPGFSRDIVSFGLVRDVRVAGPDVEVRIVLSTSEPAIGKAIRESAVAALRRAGAAGKVEVKIDIQAPVQAAGAPGPQTIEGVRAVVAVASGKGGVGKSTVAANLAASFARRGLRTGLCDCDIYGPSIALMFGVSERPLMDENNQILPIEREGIRMISMGMLLEDGSPAVLRGPMVTRTTQQFLRQVAWAPLDILILDLPPGTGDIQLTVVQTVALSGAVIVTTPQEVALIDARKAVSMFHKTGVPVLGILENMSYFESPTDGSRHAIFGEGGARREAARLRTELLGEIPIQVSLRESGDAGRPIVLAEPQSPAAKVFEKAAEAIARRVLPPS